MNSIKSTIQRFSSAKSQLLTPYNLDEKVLSRTLDDILGKNVDYADLYFQSTRSESWTLEEGIVKAGSFNIDQGFGVRAISGERTAFAYSDEVSCKSLGQAAAAAYTIAQYNNDPLKISSINTHLNTDSDVAPAMNHNLYCSDDPIVSLDASQKVSLLERIETMAKSKDPRIRQVMASLSSEYEIVLIARSDGAIATDIRPLVRLSITVISEQSGRREIGVSGGGGRFDYKYFTEELLDVYVNHAVTTALTNLEAVPSPAGNMTVVLGPGWPGVLLHEAIGHGLEGDFNRKGSSAFSGRIGSQVAARGVNIVDDATLPGRRGSLNIDDEGNPTQCTLLIEDGILKGYMQDLLNARLMGMLTTGNARRESYAALPMPRMTNTYMLNGDKQPLEIIESVQKGLYAVNFGGGQVDITNGKFVFSASEAYMIENGKISYPVKGATLIGNGPESLKYITMIGNDMSFDFGVGVCGKEGQNVPVSVGQPTLRIEKMTVGGSQ